MCREETWPVDVYSEFRMHTGRSESFARLSQVFFCYGRLSNRSMLLRYGMALRNNRYEHVHFVVDIVKILQDEGHLEALQLLKFFSLSRLKRFKLKYIAFCLELVNFCRSIESCCTEFVAAEERTLATELRTLIRVRKMLEIFVE